MKIEIVLQSMDINQQVAENNKQKDEYNARSQACETGLELLAIFDEILIHRKYDFSQCQIEDKFGQKIYYLDEDKSVRKIFCGSTIPFENYIFDNFDNQVIYFTHPPACNFCFWPFCLQTMVVYLPIGTQIAEIQQIWRFLGTKFVVKDSEGKEVLFIEGPRCPSGYTCRNVEFYVFMSDGVTQLGNITKLWIGLEEVDDHYRIAFPYDLDAKLKVTLIAACFLIDVMFYQHSRVAR